MPSNITLLRKKIKNIYLRVRPEGDILLSVPLETDQKEIDRVLEKRALWIGEQLDYFRTRQPEEKEYVSGESIEYLGRNYRLKVIQSDDEGVRLSGGYVELRIKDKNDLAQKKQMIRQWYHERARFHFHRSLGKYMSLVNMTIKTVHIRPMKTQWGSCTPKTGSIRLNPELIKKPRFCIDYVVLHELAHFVHPEHNRQFYHYLSLHMPDWKARKERLER